MEASNNCGEGPSLTPPTKKRKQAPSCIIHYPEEDSQSSLISVKDLASWETLLNAAQIRKHKPLLDIAAALEPGTVPQILYHRQCRSRFTLKRDLQALQSATQDDIPGTSISGQRLARSKPSTSRVYKKTCMFCDKEKYRRGTNTREPIVQCTELRSDQRIRECATKKQDEKILALVSRDIVAAEAHYHHSCYRLYTKPSDGPAYTSSKTDEDCLYNEAERHAFRSLFDFIRNDLFVHPRVMKLTDLTSMVVEEISQTGIAQVRDSTKKHIRRTITSEFGETVQFCSDQKGKLLLFPNKLTQHDLAKENQTLKDRISSMTWSSSHSTSVVNEVGQNIRSAIKQQQQQQAWPFTPDAVKWSNFQIPELLRTLLTSILTGDPNKKASQRVEWLLESFSQDLVYGVTCGRVKPPKHILLPTVVKSLTGNIELIQLLNRLGHGVSYDVIEENETALSLQKVTLSTEGHIPLPKCIQPYLFSSLAWDNIDFLEETATGAGTSHRVNGIVIQQKTFGPQPQHQEPVIEKKKQRSITYEDSELPIYNTGKRDGPGTLCVAEQDQALTEHKTHEKDLLWILMRQVDQENQTVPGWTGVNIMMRKNQQVYQHNIAYLNPINSPATSVTTAAEILARSMKLKESLKIKEIVLVFDQALYAKVAEVFWKHRSQYPGVVLRLGTFHMICNFASILGKRFQDAGLRDLCIEAGIVAEGSITAVMEGRHYNRSIRIHKYVYEALLRLVWLGFLPWVKEHHPDKVSHIEQTVELVSDIHEDPLDGSAYKDTLENAVFLSTMEQFQAYCEHLRSNNGPLSAFWMSYVDMVGGTLLGLIRASREGDWNAHKASVRRMITWCFAYDRQNYARYLPVYFAEMSQLSNEHPEVYQHYIEGEFSVQLGKNNPFGKIPIDQTIEETANRDTKTAGGIRKYSLKPGAVTRFYLTAEHRAAFLHHLREVLSISKSDNGHVELQPTRIKKDEQAVNAVVETLKDWVNPFEEGHNELVSLSTAAVASEQIAEDLSQAKERGEEAFQKFRTERLEVNPPITKFHDTLPKLKLKTFSEMNKKNKKISANGKDLILKADRKVFGRMVLIAQTRKNLSMQEVLGHPLGPLPWSLATEDGLPRKTNKAVLAKELQKGAIAENIPQPSATVIDGMALIQKTRGDQKTFGNIANAILLSALREGAASQRVDIVFDVYREHSIKNPERSRRQSERPITYKNITSHQIIRQWRRFLASTDNKNELVAYLAKEWQHPQYRALLQSKVLYVTCAESCTKITDTIIENVPELKSSQEEADTRLLLHAQHAASTGNSAVIVVADDTDVFLLCLAFSRQIDASLFQKCGTTTRTYYVNVNDVANACGSDVSEAIIGLHAFTGCDSVSAFAGRGKMKALKLMKGNKDFQNLFKAIGESWSLPETLQRQLEAFVCAIYGSTSGDASVNEFRYKLFCAKKGEQESYQLPPCADCLHKHSQRANYQAAVWRKSLMNDPEAPSPVGHGWKFASEGGNQILTIDWMDGAPAPNAVLEMLSCKCRKSCKAPQCPCISNHLKCTELCSLSPCENQDEDSDVELEVSSDDDSEPEDY